MEPAQASTLVPQQFSLGPQAPGRQIWSADLVASAVFVLLAIMATLVPDIFRIPFVALSCALFAIGTVAFLAAYGVALRRSRTDAITIGGIYGMGSCNSGVRWRFHALTMTQTVVALVSAAIHPFTGQAFGILVPMLGLGLGGLWAARHGEFAERFDPRQQARKQLKESINE